MHAKKVERLGKSQKTATVDYSNYLIEFRMFCIVSVSYSLSMNLSGYPKRKLRKSLILEKQLIFFECKMINERNQLAFSTITATLSYFKSGAF